MKAGKETASGRGRQVKWVVLAQAQEDVEALAEAREAVRTARFVGANLDETKSALEALKADVRERGLEFGFRSIGRPAFEALQREHPPTEDQQARAKADGRSVGWNPETFPAALCLACAVENDMDGADWEAVFNGGEWNTSEAAELFNAAIAANTDSRVVELGNS